MSIPDAQMPAYYELLLGDRLDAQRPAVESKRALARAIVGRFHGEQAALAAERRFDRIHVEHGAPDDVPVAELPPADPVHLPALIASHFGLSRSEARRLLGQGGVRLDGEQLDGDELDLAAERLEGALLQVGRRRFARLRARPGADDEGRV
jgi:tyrosyl-tRNA synthetase